MKKRKKLSLPPGTKIPEHIAIIPDGNRRWAKERSLSTFEGHKKGYQVGIEVARACRQFGIHTLTFWGFSTENWQRSKEEVAYLMRIYEMFIDQHLAEAKRDGVRIIHLGRKDRLPKRLIEKLKKAEKETVGNTKHIFNLALDYGGRDEIVRAINKWHSKEKITEDEFAKFLDTAGQPYPYPDLIIRTSGEKRLSGFLPWQGEYAELYFFKKHFPDLTPADIKKAILEYSRRERRFGK